MGLREIASAWLGRRAKPQTTPAPATAAEEPAPSPRIFVLNSLIDVPTSCATKAYEGSSDAELYLLDHNYVDRARTLHDLSGLARVGAERGLDFSGKTLLLAAKGLRPIGDELIGFLHEFRDHYVFFELWNGLKEVVELSEVRVDNLFFLPVTARLLQVNAARVSVRPSSRVFVSLGGDDDLDLIRRVIAACPQLHFCVPDVSWAKPGSQKRFLDVRIEAGNVTAVDCSPVRERAQLEFTTAYRSAYDSCDTVLIATTADKMYQLRGGVRFADALYARKHIVATENAPCQLLMAQHEKTCLVAEHDARQVAEHLARICDGGFQVDESVYEAIRQLTVEEEKLAWMIRAAAAPESARRSVFARSHDLLETARRALFPRGRELLEREIQSVLRSKRPAPHSGSPLPD